MARLPEVPRRLVTTDMPQSRISGADVAASYRAAADALAAGGEALANYEHATGLRTYTRLADEARSKAQDLSIAAGGNADAFEKSWQVYSRDVLRRTSGTAKQLIEGDLVSLGGNETRRIKGQNYTADIANSKAAITGEIDRLDNEAATWARVSGTSSQDYLESRRKIGILYDQLGANPAFGTPKEQAANELRRLDSRHMAEGIVGSIDRTWRDKGSAGAEAEARRLLWDPKLDLTPEERRAYVGRATEYLQSTAAQRKAALGEVQDQAKQVKAMLDADPRLVDDSTVDHTIGQLSALGDVSGAMDLMQKRAGVRFLSGAFNAAGDRGQVDLYNRMFSPDGKGSAGLLDRSREAIAGIESAGSGGYSAVGPETKTGDHAYGRYQVMGANIPAWTKETLGRAMTPEEFKADPKAQDAVFNDQFGKLVARYGNVLDAASAWFTGRPRATGANAADALGTTGTGYVAKFAAAMGDAGQPYNPATDPAVVKAMRGEITADLKTHWSSIKEGLAKNLPPSAEELGLIADQLAIVDDPALKAEIGDYFKNHADGYLLQNVPPADAEALLARMKADDKGFDAGQIAAIDAADKAVSAAKQQLSEDPLGFAVGRHLADAPPPLNVADPAQLAGGLAQRQKIADVVGQRFQTGPVSALRPAERQAVATAWQGADTNGKLALLGAMTQSLKPDTLMATLAGFADKAETLPLAVAGALSATAPEVGAAVVRGTEALKTNPKFAFDRNTSEAKAATDGTFPATALAPTMTAAWQAHLDAARAVYADASARAGDTSGAFNADRWQAAIDQVTGGTVEFNGQKTVTPRRGIDQARFDEVMAALPDAALVGGMTPDGAPLNADFIRRRGKLQGTADGRYVITIGDTGAYALAVPRTPSEAGVSGAFELDLRPWLDLPARTADLPGFSFDPVGDAKRLLGTAPLLSRARTLATQPQTP